MAEYYRKAGFVPMGIFWEKGTERGVPRKRVPSGLGRVEPGSLRYDVRFGTEISSRRRV
jgi:hypothetical protein